MRRTVCSSLLALVVCAPAAAANAPHVQERIIPGQAIGKVRIGMTLKQVKAVLGRPESLIKRERRSFTREWVEYSWDFTTWRIGFEVYRGTSRAVSIRASVRGERTKEGIGYGADASRVQRAYRTTCKPAYTNREGWVRSPLGYACPVRGGFFIANALCGNVPTAGGCATKDRRWGVIEFGVLAPNEKPPYDLVDFDEYWKPIP